MVAYFVRTTVSDFLHFMVDLMGVLSWLAIFGGIANWFWHVLGGESE